MRLFGKMLLLKCLSLFSFRNREEIGNSRTRLEDWVSGTTDASNQEKKNEPQHII